jgi:hypothetical protein
MNRQLNAKVTYPTLGHTVLSTGQDVYRDSDVEVIVHVGEYHYEFYDVATRGEKYYAEGSLDIQDGKLVDYDGVGSLPTVIMDMLSNEWDIDVMEVYDNDGQPNKYTLFNYEVGDKVFEDGRDAMDYIHSLNLDSDAFRTMMQSILNP